MEGMNLFTDFKPGVLKMCEGKQRWEANFDLPDLLPQNKIFEVASSLQK